MNKTFEKILLDFMNVRSALTLGAFGLYYGLLWQGKPIPESLNSFVFMLQGFWFGQKVANAINSKTEGEQK